MVQAHWMSLASLSEELREGFEYCCCCKRSYKCWSVKASNKSHLTFYSRIMILNHDHKSVFGYNDVTVKFTNVMNSPSLYCLKSCHNHYMISQCSLHNVFIAMGWRQGTLWPQQWPKSNKFTLKSKWICQIGRISDKVDILSMVRYNSLSSSAKGLTSKDCECSLKKLT